MNLPDSIWWWGIAGGLALHIFNDAFNHWKLRRISKFLGRKFPKEYMNGED